MRILDLHIDAFGKLVDFSYRAEPGMNLITGENEYGKSTILAFIRAMLYGFGKRSGGRLKDYDRRKYAPWYHSAYGGSMTFSHNGIIYRLERSFAISRAEDQTMLSINATGTRIDLAADEPGTVLFQMDESEFVNTVYIGQLATPFSKSGRDPDALAARLMNLSQSGEENVSFDEIDKRLLSESIKIKAARGQGGILPRLYEEQETNRSMAAEVEAIRAEASSLQAMIEEKKKEETELWNRQIELRETLSQLQLQAEQQKKELMEAKLHLQSIEEKKDLRIERMAEQERENREYRKQQTEISSRYANELTARELDVARAKEEMEMDRKRFYLRVCDLKSRMNQHQLRICEIQDEIFMRQADVLRREEEILVLGADSKDAEQECDALKKLHIRLGSSIVSTGWLMVIFICSAIILFFILLNSRNTWSPASFILVLPAIALFIANRVQLRRASERHLLLVREYETCVSALRSAKETSLGCEESLQKEKQTLEYLEQSLEDNRRQRKAEVLLSHRMLRMTQDSEADIRRRIKQSADHSAPETSYSQHSLSCSEVQITGDPCASQVSAEEEIEEFESQILTCQDQLSGLEDMSERMRSEMAARIAEEQGLSTSLTDVRVAVARLETAKEALWQHMPDESRVEEEAEQIQERIERMTIRKEAITAAREALSRAYSDMEHSFVPQVNERTAGYLSALTDKAYATIRMDREFTVEMMATGENAFRNLDHFSGGTVDQLYFSLRLAIGDLIRRDEEFLPLLLDDTFVQYDDKRALEAMRLLHQLTKERQIFIFTCQERMRDLYDKAKAVE